MKIENPPIPTVGFSTQSVEPPEGFEPSTYGLRNRRSTRLSHGGPIEISSPYKKLFHRRFFGNSPKTYNRRQKMKAVLWGLKVARPPIAKSILWRTEFPIWKSGWKSLSEKSTSRPLNFNRLQGWHSSTSETPTSPARWPPRRKVTRRKWPEWCSNARRIR